MYTTTQRRLLPGPVTTFSVSTGAAACAVAQLGSLAISIGFIFGGVPVYVTLPLMVPAARGGAALTSPPVTSVVARTAMTLGVTARPHRDRSASTLRRATPATPSTARPPGS